MAEYFLAACALQDACTSAKTLCLLLAASAETANDATRTAASIETSNFFMLISPLPPNASETSKQTFSFRLFSVSSFRKRQRRKRQRCRLRKPSTVLPVLGFQDSISPTTVRVAGSTSKILCGAFR